MGQQHAPRVDAAGEHVDERFADRGHRGRRNGEKEKRKRGHPAVAPEQAAICQQPDQKPGHQYRLVDVELGLDEEMHGPEHGDAVHEPVQHIPAGRA
jgi:hypothetical protein